MRGAIPAYPVVGLVQAPVYLPRLVMSQAGHFYLLNCQPKRILKESFNWLNIQLKGDFFDGTGVILRRVPDAF